MRKATLWLTVMVALFALVSCGSTTNVGPTAGPSADDRQTFSISTEDGVGTFEADFSVQENADGATVTINANNAQELRAAYVNVHYDAKRFSPESVEVSNLLGQDDQVLTIALTNIDSVVPIGVTQIEAANASPVSGSGHFATVTFAARPFTAARGASQAPKGASNAVKDLVVSEFDGSNYTLAWTEKNSGDYNNDGLVGIADLTPLGALFGANVADTSNPVWAGLVDGDGNGQINIADLTPIGANFGNELTGYKLYADENEHSGGIDAMRSDFFENNQTPVRYSVTVDYGESAPEFYVRPVEQSSIADPGPESNTAVIAIEPGAPAAPTTLSAVVGETIGMAKVKLDWSGSTSIDVFKYEIERKLAVDGDETFENVGNVIAPATTYTDTVESEDEYSYRVRAVDTTTLFSDYSNSFSATPWYPEAPPAPENVAAVEHPSIGNAIQVSWEAPADTSNILQYRVYRKAGAELEFTLVANKTPGESSHSDTGLTAATDYAYMVRSVGQFAIESDDSNTSTAQPSVKPIEILDVTTDKTTHHINGDGVNANLEVVIDGTADTVVWNAPQGTIVGSGANVEWQPGSGMPVGTLTIEVTVSSGAQIDSSSVDLYITGQTIKTGHNDRGGGGSIPVGSPTAGFMTDTNLASFSYLEPLADGGNIGTMNQMLSELTDGKVVLLDRWELWCQPCKAEFPELDNMADFFGDYDYIMVSMSNDNRPQYSLSSIKTWFQSNGIDNCYQFFNVPNSYWDTMGYDYFIPYNVIVDKDGAVRWTGGNAEGTYNIIEELTGSPNYK